MSFDEGVDRIMEAENERLRLELRQLVQERDELKATLDRWYEAATKALRYESTGDLHALVVARRRYGRVWREPSSI
jgi:hypothetical protein